MTPRHPNRRSSDRLTILADALLLTVVAGALLAVLNSSMRVSVPIVDTFLATMAISSVAGATGAWFLHRRRAGVRGAALLAAGLVIAVLLVLGCENAIISAAKSSPAFATVLYSVVQVMGLVFMVVLIVAGAKNLLRPGRRRFQAVAVTRVAALTGIAALIAIRFLPQTQTDLITARVDAVLALSTIAGAIAVGIADTALRAMRPKTDDRDRRTALTDEAA